MRITIEIGGSHSSVREASVRIAGNELAAVHLNLASPEKRNRTGLYMRRHPSKSQNNTSAGTTVGPNDPLRSPQEPPKMPIPAHIEEMRRRQIIPSCTGPKPQTAEKFGFEPTMIAVPISDLVANLLRPCYHRLGLGQDKLFHFDEEPISRRDYWCACFFRRNSGAPRFELRYVHFDTDQDQALDLDNTDLTHSGLIWAAALVPLVVDGKPLSAVQIAQNNYDLRQILGPEADKALRYAYEGWYDEWDERVEKIVLEHEGSGRSFARYYHSVLGLDETGNIHVIQKEAVLPELALRLAHEGIVAAGVLDSGGSCALYDVWMESYLNHNWYFREPRGSILVFQLTSSQRIPEEKPDCWISRRRKA